MEIYLDNAATTQVCREAADVAAYAMREEYGNPGSTHAKGRRARDLLDTARRQVASGLGCAGAEIFFTSGGSESDNWAVLKGAECQKRRGKHIITSLAEHDAVRRPMEALAGEGFDITYLKPDAAGAIPVAAVEEALREDTVLVSLMLVNNETGGVTDIAGVAELLKKKKSAALLHTDAVQGFMKIPFTAKSLGADLISVSGHKLHAPKGVGALYIRRGLRLPPLILGGGQENGLRSGTEPIAQIAAFGKAAEIALEERAAAGERMSRLKKRCLDALLGEDGIRLIGGTAPHIVCLSLPGYRSEVLMNYLEAENIYVSKSSACRRGKRSHVLKAMGLPNPVIDGAVRVSFSRFTTEEECGIFCETLLRAKRKLRHT